jgi:outer membrane protein assembly factor BamB
VTHAAIRILAVLLLSALPAAADNADWSQWRGPKHDGLSPDTGLLKEWTPAGPPLAWKATGLGDGYSTPTVLGDRIYTLGDTGDKCNLIALNAADGKAIWTTPIGKNYIFDEKHPDWGSPRCSPSTDGKLVIALAPHGELVCVDAATGKEKWQKNLINDFGGKVGNWKYSESPLLDGDNVICMPGGSKGTVLALTKETGEVVWQSKDLTDPAEYQSLVPVEIGGIRQYLAFTGKSLAGIAAADGKVLWRADRPGKVAVIPTPVYKDGIVFVTSGYGVGCNAFKITESGGKFTAEQIYANTKMKNHHGGVILLGDHVYGFDEGILRCMELKTGNVVWENKSVGKGSIAYADGHFVVRGEKTKGSEIALIEASPAGYKEKGRFSQPEYSPKPTWCHPVIIGGKMYLRDWDTMYCYDVKAK